MKPSHRGWTCVAVTMHCVTLRVITSALRLGLQILQRWLVAPAHHAHGMTISLAEQRHWQPCYAAPSTVRGGRLHADETAPRQDDAVITARGRSWMQERSCAPHLTQNHVLVGIGPRSRTPLLIPPVGRERVVRHHLPCTWVCRAL